jgi:hypothetical protein
MFEYEDNIIHMHNINPNISMSHLDTFYQDLNTIENMEPNLKNECLIYYEYLQGLIQLNVLSKNLMLI